MVKQPAARSVVLVVEDEPDHRMMLELLLGSYGYDVITAASCAAGRIALHENVIDVLLTDFFLGDGTALELVAHLGERRPRVTVVMSGLDGPEHIERSLQNGFDAHLVKPTSLETLRDVIAQGLRKRRSGVRLAQVASTEAPAARTKRTRS
jgi:two-component system response regulator PilR (NtrC family)